MKKAFTTSFLILMISIWSFSQDGWTQLANYPGSGTNSMTGIGYGSNGLAGLGYYGTSSSNNFKDWWEYFPATDSWLQKTSLTGSARYLSNGFTIGDNAYVCLGSDGIFGFFNDLWQYNSMTNSWVEKASFPGATRYNAIAQSSGTKAYVGLGEHDYGSGISDYFTDFYEFDEITNTWTSKETFPGQARAGAFSFLINNMIYVVGGRTNYGSGTSEWVYLKDMWAYDISNNTWSQKTTYPGGGSYACGGFALGQYGYVGTGWDGSSSYHDFWRYNPQTETWTQLPNFPGAPRSSAMSFSIDYTGYLGCGFTSESVTDFWEYVDPSTLGINKNIDESIRLYPVPLNSILTIENLNVNKNNDATISIYNTQGQMLLQQFLQLDKNIINMSNFDNGVYIVRVIGTDINVVKKIIKE